MKSTLLKSILILALPIILSSCFGQHNEAPSKGVNLDSERVYGIRGGEPKQLKMTYPDDDGTQALRTIEIRNKMFPK